MEFTVAQIIQWTGGRLANELALGESAQRISARTIADLKDARDGSLAFFFNRAYQEDFLKASPSVLITAEPFLKPIEGSGHPIWKKSAIISCADPYLAMAVLSEHFAGELSSVAHQIRRLGGAKIHPSAVVSKTAELGDGVDIGPHCVIEDRVRIGAGTTLYPGCYLGPGAVIGEDCVLFPQVTIYERTELGNRVRIHAGTVIGADGFGYAPVRESGKVVDHRKIFHLGRVVIGNDVEIGAKSTVDRGTFGDTVIGGKSKLDDQVHVGHNCRLGEGVILCGCTGLGGNTEVGNFVYVGGGVAIVNSPKIGDGAMVGAGAVVTRDIAPGATALGDPQRDRTAHFRVHALLTKLLEERKLSRKSKEQES